MRGRKQNSTNTKQEENKETNEKITRKLAKIPARKIVHIWYIQHMSEKCI